MNGALEEGATVKIGATLVDGATLKIGKWLPAMPSLLEPNSKSIDSTGIEKQLQLVASSSDVVPCGKHTAHN